MAEFTPQDVGPHTLTVEYNGQPVGGTPFVSKAYDAKRVYVGPLPRGQVGKTLEFLGEILIKGKTKKLINQSLLFK